MNTVALCTLLTALVKELEQTRDKLMEVIDALCSMVANPGDADVAQGFGNSRKSMYAFLSAAPSNSFSRMQRIAMEQIGVAGYLGDSMMNKMESTIRGNGIDSASVEAAFREFHQHITLLHSSASNMVNGFATLKIQPDALNVGESVFTFVIPEGVIKGDMSKLAKEMKEMDRMISNLSELLAGERKDGYKIRAIGAGSCVVSVVVDGLVLANGLLALILIALKCYKELLGIKQLRQNILEERSLLKKKQEILQLLDSEEAQIIADKIGEAVEQFVKDQKVAACSKRKPSARKKGKSAVASADALRNSELRNNELRTELRIVFKSILQKMEQGFVFDMDSGKPEDPGEEEEGKALPESAKISEIRDKISLFREEAKQVGDEKTGFPLLSVREDSEDREEE